jgi:putative ABC transport system permease protein
VIELEQDANMTTAIKPVFLAMMRSRGGPTLVAFQIAVALAVLVNAAYVAEQRVAKMSRPTGIDERNLFSLSSVGFTSRFNPEVSAREDLTYIRSAPGVVAATRITAAPLSQGGNITSLSTRPDKYGARLQISYYEMDEQGLATLGVPLREGRYFRREEILPPSTPQTTALGVSGVIVTQSLGQALFPAASALGRTVYFDNHPVKIIGVMRDMAGPGWPSNLVSFYNVVLLPRLPTGTSYLVRTAPGQRDAVMRTVADHLAASNPDRLVEDVHSLDFFRRLLYMQDRNMAIFLLTVTTLLVAISCIGVFGLVTFNVARRTKQIGTRRAVGARRADIIRYFMVENALITTAGVVTGCALALGAGYWLSIRLLLPRLDLYYLVGGVLVLWSISQLAAWHPARRAATVPPSVATRTV